MPTEHELRNLWETVKDALRREGLFRHCTDCYNWDEEKEVCKLCNQRPPANVIVKGCDQFDEIPF